MGIVCRWEGSGWENGGFGSGTAPVRSGVAARSAGVRALLPLDFEGWATAATVNRYVQAHQSCGSRLRKTVREADANASVMRSPAVWPASGKEPGFQSGS
jgi:hypothetical protein